MAITQQGSNGYYAQSNPVGKAGDFITATNFGPLLPYALAYNITQHYAQTDYDVMEVGAGSGKMAIDFLKASIALSHPPKRYIIDEPSPTLKKVQKKRLQNTLPEFFNQITWLGDDQLVESFSGAVIANEVLDCLAFHRVKKKQDRWHEQVITLTQSKLVWETIALDPTLTQYINQYMPDDLPNNYHTEICLNYQLWLENLKKKIKCATLFLIDYGYETDEYFHSQRHMGTLCCFYQHQKHQNPLINLGKQDITAHIQFSALLEVAETLGYRLESYQTQAQFVLERGTLAYLESAKNYPKLYRALQNNLYALTDPNQMGNVFKCMTLSI